MPERLDVSVPATLSNLGPGFDVLGMALELTNTFSFTLDRPSGEFAEGGHPIPPRSHTALKTVLDARARFGGQLPGGLSVAQTEGLPRSRGLGSSATARVAGFVAWSHFTGMRPPLEDALGFLAAEEGHPDNAVPALVGGLCAATSLGHQVRFVRVAPPARLRVALVIPEVRVATQRAREVLPRQLPRETAVQNLSRLAFLLFALLAGHDDALALGTEDAIHQPFRAPLIGPVDEALAAARAAGAGGGFISGSGSTLAAFVVDPSADARAVAEAMAAEFRARGIGAEGRVVAPRLAGATAPGWAPYGPT